MDIFTKAIEFSSMTTHQIRIFLGLLDYADLEKLAFDNVIPVADDKAGLIVNLGMYREKLDRYVAIATVL